MPSTQSGLWLRSIVRRRRPFIFPISKSRRTSKENPANQSGCRCVPPPSKRRLQKGRTSLQECHNLSQMRCRHVTNVWSLRWSSQGSAFSIVLLILYQATKPRRAITSQHADDVRLPRDQERTPARSASMERSSRRRGMKLNIEREKHFKLHSPSTVSNFRRFLHSSILAPVSQLIVAH